MLLKSLSIRNKLMLTIILPVVGIIIIIVTSLSQLQSANDGVDRIYEDRVVPLQHLKIIADEYAVQVIDAVNKANAGILTGAEALQGIQAARKNIAHKWRDYRGHSLGDVELKMATDAEQLFVMANRSLDRLETGIKQVGLGNIEGQLAAYDGPLYQDIDPISEKISSLINLQLQIAAEERRNVQTVYTTSLTIMLVLGVCLMVILAVLGLLVYRSIRQPLDALRFAMNEVAEKSDLTAMVEVSSHDELGQMSENFNQMLARQRVLIGGISSATLQLASAAEEMSSISEQTNQSIGHQRMEIEQVASAMNQMVSTSQDVAKSAEQADSQTKVMQEQAHQGNGIVSAAVASTNSLIGNVAQVSERICAVEKNSENIDSIINVIKEIADQTNLLALNAAIEAARAGDQGRGFSVVADEVRTLAQRTQQSTTEIQSAIERLQVDTRSAVNAMEQSQAEAEQTGGKAAEAGSALQGIAAAVSMITDMNTHIASASEEQTSVAEAINRSLVAINDSAQGSSEGAEQLSIASDELSKLAAELNTKVGQFKT